MPYGVSVFHETPCNAVSDDQTIVTNGFRLRDAVLVRWWACVPRLVRGVIGAVAVAAAHDPMAWLITARSCVINDPDRIVPVSWRWCIGSSRRRSGIWCLLTAVPADR